MGDEPGSDAGEGLLAVKGVYLLWLLLCRRLRDMSSETDETASAYWNRSVGSPWCSRTRAGHVEWVGDQPLSRVLINTSTCVPPYGSTYTRRKKLFHSLHSTGQPTAPGGATIP